MPYVSNQGVRIYYQTEGDGAPLVLQHGFSDSLESWYESGYVDALKSDYQLILVDARGHGRSDKPHDPEAYDSPYFVADIVAMLDALSLPKVHYFGYSMGAGIGFGIATYGADRIHSFILGGSHPYQPPPASADPWIPMLQEGPNAVPSIWEMDAPISLALRDRLLSNDVEALVAYRQKRGELPGDETVLPTMTMPCLLFAGEADSRYARVKECITHMPNVTFVSVPDLGHIDTFFRSDLVLPDIKRFLHRICHTSDVQ